jgi:CHAT domain-containing protein
MSTPALKQNTAVEAHAPAARRQWPRMALLLSLTIILIAAGSGAGIWWKYCYGSSVDKAWKTLQTRHIANRPTQSRLSGFAYAPYVNLRGTQTVEENAQTAMKLDVNGSRRTRGAQSGSEKIQLLTEKQLLESISERPSTEAYRVLGCFYMAEHRWEDSVDAFQGGLKIDSQNARLHSDLGAALLEKGQDNLATDQDGNTVEAFSWSLSHLNRALALDSRLQEAFFNRALLHEHMMLREQAIEDWRTCIEKDSNSLWADEARQNLEKLEQNPKTVRKNRLEAFLNAYKARDAEQAWMLFTSNREGMITELLDTYLNITGNLTKKVSREALDALTYVSELDTQRTGDRFAFDIARFYQSASTQQTKAAAEARDIFNKAAAAYAKSQLEKADALHTKAQSIFSKTGNRCEALLANYWVGQIYLEMTRVENSELLFDQVARDCESQGYAWLLARTFFYQSGIEFTRREFSKAISVVKQARTQADTIADKPCVLAATSALIEYYRTLENQYECFREISYSLSLLNQYSFGSMSLGRHYGIAAMTFNTFGFYDAAIDYQKESLRFALPDDSAALSVFNAHLGRMYGKLQKYAEAFEAINRAYTQAEEHKDHTVRQEKMAYATLQMGNLYRDRADFANALASYDHSIDLYKSMNFPMHLYQAYKGRLACYIAQDDATAVQQQADELMTLMDQHREKIFEEENRNKYFDTEQSVYDLVIDFWHSRRQDEVKAFEYAEASRARSLLYSIASVQHASLNSKSTIEVSSVRQPFSLEQIQASLPDNVQLLQYAVLQNKLLIWIISRNGFQVAETQISESEIIKKVTDYVDSVVEDSETESEVTSYLARELHKDLIAPVESQLNKSNRVYVIPDKVLHYIPWDALISPATGRYLIEDYAVMSAPSATLFSICTEIAGQKAGARDEHTMIVGNPSFDDINFPGFEQLPEAEYEAKKIAEFYTSPQKLIGPDAREQAVRNEMVKADVLHFASHGFVNKQAAMRSSILLTKEPASSTKAKSIDGALQASEIYDMKLPHTRLAVLAACQTGVERYYRGEGRIGIARAFLVAGVPLVVASLWRVDSKPTAQLMIRFHEYRKRAGMATPEALREAKFALLRGSVKRYRLPYYWAAFQSTGGEVSF